MRPQKKTHRHKGSKKSGLGKGWCGKFEKKIDEHINGCGILAYRVPRFPLFPPSTLPLDNNNSFIWIFPSCGKKKWVLQCLPEHVLLCTGSTRAVQSLFKIVYNEKYSELVVLYSLGVWRRVCLRGKHFSLVNLDKYYRFY